jgi:ATP-binding cassette subfamily B protein
MREEPLLRIFDEPSAAGRGAITVFVSHRFSTVLAADLIVVLQDGRIAEVGDRQALMRAGGSYADLFNLQLRGYS